jgi:enoyl-CoA hydratase/carnithine racemase
MESGGKAVDPFVLRETHDGVVTLRLNRPQQFNALSSHARSAARGLRGHRPGRLGTLRRAGRRRQGVLRGARSARDARSPDLAYYRTLFAQCSVVMQAIQALPVPVIARVHGIATAAGCQLVASCDLAIASVAAKFAVSGINVGLFAPRHRWRCRGRPNARSTCW